MRVCNGKTGTFKATFIDYTVIRDIDDSAREIESSPEFTGDESGLTDLRLWIRERMAHIVGIDWMSLYGTEALLTNDELDLMRPGWRVVPYIRAGSEIVESRVIDRPIIDISLETTCLALPFRRTIDGERAELGLIVHGPTYWSDDALESMPTYTEEQISEMAKGIRPFPKEMKRN